jgi:hypothetical protein
LHGRHDDLSRHGQAVAAQRFFDVDTGIKHLPVSYQG